MKTQLVSLVLFVTLCGCDAMMVTIPHNQASDASADSASADAGTRSDASQPQGTDSTTNVQPKADTEQNTGSQADAGSTDTGADTSFTLDAAENNGADATTGIDTIDAGLNTDTAQTNGADVTAGIDSLDAGTNIDAGLVGTDAAMTTDTSANVDSINTGLDTAIAPEPDAGTTDTNTADAGSTDTGADTTFTLDASSPDSTIDAAQDSGADVTTEADTVDSGTNIDADNSGTDAVSSNDSVDAGSDVTTAVCDEIACGMTGGTCEANVCKTFCDTCATETVCEDSNLDGLGDKCTPIPANYIAQYYNGLVKSIDIAIVVVMPGIPQVSNFYGIHFETYKKIADIYTDWFNYPQWMLMQSNYFVMELYDGMPANVVESAKTSGFNDPDVCGVRFNADISMTGDVPVNHWLCEGNGAAAHWLDPGTRFFRAKNSVLIEITKHVKIWSAPDGVQSGCSANVETKTCSN